MSYLFKTAQKTRQIEKLIFLIFRIKYVRLAYQMWIPQSCVTDCKEVVFLQYTEVKS